MSDRLQCPNCERLIATRRRDGRLEVRRRGLPVATIERGAAHCPGCGAVIVIDGADGAVAVHPRWRDVA